MRIACFLLVVCAGACGRSSLEGNGAPGSLPPTGIGTVGTTATLHITPPSVTLPTGATQQFSADRPVAWSVVESGGGAIDGSGLYGAPAMTGTFTVAAAASDGSGLTARAIVTVRARRLELLAGMLDSTGNGDGTGSDARFNWPAQLAYDGAGTLYIADYANGTIRKLDVASGAVTTLARALHAPCGLALDGHGGLYVSEQGNDTVSRVALADGSVVSVAGVPGQFGFANGAPGQSLFYYVSGLAWDAGRNRLYIADSYNGVRIYDPALATISTASDSSVSFESGLAFDGATQLYIDDDWGVSRLDVTSGERTVLAGGSGGFADGVGSDGHTTASGQIALDVAGNAVYFADVDVRKLDLATNRLTTLAGPRDYVWGGAGLALDGAGGLFVSSQVANAIAHEALDGSGRTIIAGPTHVQASGPAAYADGIGAAARFNAPAQLAGDGGSTLYVADGGNRVVRRIDVASAAVSTFAGAPWGFDRDGRGSAGRLAQPSHLAADGAGGYIVVESNAQTVRRWSPAGNRLTTLAGDYDLPGSDDGRGTRARFSSPGGACVYQGAVYLADTNNDTIRKIELQNGTVSTLAGKAETRGTSDGVGASARFYHPNDVICDGVGGLYVADSGNFLIRRIDIASAGVTHVTHTISIIPRLLAHDAQWLYVLDDYHSAIDRISLTDGSDNTLATLTQAEELVSMTTDGAGNVFVSDRFGTFYRIAADGTVAVLANPKGSIGAVDGPFSVAGFGDAIALLYDGGTILVAETNGGTLRRIDLAAATVSTVFGAADFYGPQAGIGDNALFADPLALALDGGQLYVGDYGLAVVDVASRAVTLPVAASPSLAQIGGVAGDGAGHVYSSDTSYAVIRRYDTSDGSSRILAGTAGTTGSSDGVGAAALFDHPAGLALDGNTLYIADTGNDTIRALSLLDDRVDTLAGLAGSSGSDDGVGGAARFSAPGALATDGKGHLFVADPGNGLVRRIDLAGAAVSTIVGVAGQHGVITGGLPARLNRPSGLFLLGDGSLAISDEQAVLILR